jgi:protein dithiol oxidoreductase (disulfide-forming)
MKLRYLLISLLLLALGGCDTAEQIEPEAAATDESGEMAEATEVLTEELTEEEVAEIEALNEAGETEDEEADETVVVEEQIVLTEESEPAQQGDWKYQEGKHFRRMTISQGTSSAPDKIEVAEVFWYGCPHCYDFEPVLDEWKSGLPSDVTFVRIPVVWSPTHQIHARIMYTAEALGKLNEMHAGVFEAMHQKGERLTTEDEIVELFAEYDVSEEDFREAFNSFGVSSSVKRAENLGRRYNIRSVPVIVVNGKYATDAPDIRGFAEMIGVTDELVERERAAL